MKTTSYSDFCEKRLGNILKKYKTDEKSFNLIKADIHRTYEEYYATALISTILATIVSIIFAIILYNLAPSLLTAVLLVIIPGLTILTTISYYLYLPSYCIKKRATDIDLYLPYAINFISSMAVAGISPTEIFETLSKISVYGEVQEEAKKITKEIAIMGIDNITALKNAIEASPSKKFKSFLQGIIGTIQSGSDLHEYLSTVAKKYMDEDATARKRDLDLLAVIAEVLVLSLIAFPIFLVIILTVMGFFGGPGGSLEILLLFSFVILPLLYFFFYLLIKSTSIEKLSVIETRKNFDLKKSYKQNKNSYLIVLTSIISMVALFLITESLGKTGFLNVNLYVYWDLLFISILILIGPIGIYEYLEFKKKKEIQERLPDFLIEVGDALSTGMNIFDAINIAEKGHYGRLGPEIKKMKSQLSWNVSMKNVLFDFADRMKSAIIQRVIIVIDKGLMMGGNTPKIFKAAANEVSQVNQIEMQRRTNMSIYALVMLMCFFVFLGIILMLYNNVFASFFEIQAKQAAGVGGTLKLNPIDINMLNYTLYSFVFVQSLGAGLLAGFMMDGRLSSGIRYSLILGIISIVIFKVIV